MTNFNFYKILVGQNENIIRQQAKESGVEVSPVLIPSSIPRITDVPRINGKGGLLMEIVCSIFCFSIFLT